MQRVNDGLDAILNTMFMLQSRVLADIMNMDSKRLMLNVITCKTLRANSRDCLAIEGPMDMMHNSTQPYI